MKFTRRDNYHARSECGRYTVAQVTVAGRRRIEAWRSGANRLALHAEHLPADEQGRRDAWRRCVQACERDAGVVA